MRIYTSSVTQTIYILLLALTTTSLGKKAYETDDLISLVGDLTSLESEEKKSILKSLLINDDYNVGEESKQSVSIQEKSSPSKNHDSYETRNANKTDKSYDVVQWYARPSRIVEHHVQGRNGESHDDNFKDTRDFNSHSSNAYSEPDHNQNDDHYHTDHHHHHNDQSIEDDAPSFTSFHHQDTGNNHDDPTSEVFYRKLKLKKVRRNCTRTKTKKQEVWPDRSDSNVQGRFGGGIELPHIHSNSHHQSVPAFHGKRFNDISNAVTYPIAGNAMGFSGEHLHGIPRTHFFQYKDGEGVNHYHLHNHHHIYDANGNKINLESAPAYRNLVEHFGKLKSMLNAKESAGTPYSQINDHYRSTLSLGNSEPNLSPPIDDNNQKKGYHYTGAHESYGRKTYKRIHPSTSVATSDDSDKSIGLEMYRYGAGQYGTDEFSSHEQQGPYPNEVSLSGVDKSYPGSGEIYEPLRQKPYSSSGSLVNYNSDISSDTPFTPFSGDFSKTEKYNQNYKDKPSYNSQDKAPYVPQDKAPYVPQDKPSYGTSSHSSRPSSAEFHGYSGHPTGGPSSGELYPTPYNSADVKNGPSVSPNTAENPSDIENSPPSPPQVTHSESYSQDGELIDTINLGPDNFHLYQNLRPEADPLTIPKNARIFEHYIRLHPMHYMLPGLGRMPINMPTSFGNPLYPLPLNKFPVPLPKHPAVLPKYPVPLHKLIPNPLKMPLVPPAPLYPRFPAAHLNQMLMPFQIGAPFNRW